MKIQFPDLDDLEEWLDGTVERSKYDLYLDLTDGTLYAIKNVSTEPLMHAHCDDVSAGKAPEGTVTVVGFDWDHGDTPATNP